MNDAQLTKKILSLKQDQEKAEKQINILLGKQEQIISTLKKTFKIKTIEEAEQILKEKKKEKEKLHNEIKEIIEDIDAYDF